MQAFEVLNGSSECHKIVMVITDKDVDGQQLNQTIEDHKLLVQVFVVA
jgi:5S rRNA maturation endonuclease (ribonuclease M5)